MRAHRFNRPPRVRPRWGAEEVALPAPPAPPASQSADRITMLMPVVGSGLMVSVAVAGGGSWLFALPAGAMAGLGVVAAMRSERAASRRGAAEHAARLAFFEDQLDAARSRLRRLYEQERAARLHLDPDPAELLAIVGVGSRAAPDPRLWERRPADDDFLALRVGSGDLPATCTVTQPPPAADSPVDLRLPRIAADYATLRQVPISIPLGQLGSLGVAGPRPQALALLQAMIWQAAVLHAPADLRVALVAPASGGEWEWLRWLPHSIPPSNEPAHSQRMCATDGASSARLMSDILDQLSRRREAPGRSESTPIPLPRLLLVIDGTDVAGDYPAAAEIMRHGPSLGMAVIVLAGAWPHIPEACAAMLDVGPTGARWVRAGEPWPQAQFTHDRADTATSDRLARRMAGIRLQEGGGSQDVPRSVRLFDLLGLRGESDLSPPRYWAEPLAGAWRGDVPIGAVAEGTPICLDLNESRHGPHGIIAGATGAGKSVLLQSIIAALAVTHGPERLQLLLIDFKGGAALSMFAGLPHVAGLVTDLEGRLAERAMTAIKSELRRRKALLKATAAEAGSKVENVSDYRALAAAHGLAPLPNLLIVVDEFDEMASSYQEFVAELVRVVKQGRSLGVHLLVATQQPARAVSDEIRSQLKYFIALRLGSSDDSREMILKPDAAFLPTDIPGRAYFRAGADLRIFQVAQVTGAHRSGQESAAPRVSFVSGSRERPIILGGNTEDEAQRPRETDLDVLVRALGSQGDAGRQPPIWRAPLPARLTLGAVMALTQPPLPERERGSDLILAQDLPSPFKGEGQGVRVCIGLLDIPQECRQEPFALDLAAAHLAVIGAPGSGKTMLLRSLILSLAAVYSSADLWLYMIDAGGQGLAPLVGLPHVAALIQARERERVRRLIRMLDAAIRERQDRLRAADAADLQSYRGAGGRDMPALLLVIDKLAVLCEEFRDSRSETTILDDLVRLARVGRACGVYLAISADRAADLSYRLLSLCDARIALRQAEIHDYADILGARVSAPIPATLPGRALWAHADHGPLEVQVALPSLEPPAHGEDAPGAELSARALDSELLSDLRDQAAAIASAWRATPGAEQVRPLPVELLPERISLASLASPSAANIGAGLAAPIGRESMALAVAELRLNDDSPHALIIGPRRSGKTSALDTILRGLASVHAPPDLELLILDGPRGGLAALRDLPNTTHYARAEQGADTLIAAVADLRRARDPGPRRIIAIDDYTLCRERLGEQLGQSYGPEPNLLAHLCDLAQSGGQQGIHILLTTTMTYVDDALLRALDGGRGGIILWPGRYDGGTRLLGVGMPLAEQREAEQPPGRALLVRDDEQAIIQIALA
ncbi:cell division protein FtsK [Chloroflexales bacterium ZM16-3]|nr:cell division protein FtsK [Chloroflexales bacterium ZM16-3]